MRRHIRTLLACLVVLLPAALAAKDASVDLRVDPGDWTAVELRALPDGTTVDLRYRADGAVALRLVAKAAHLARGLRAEPLVSQAPRRKGRLTADVPESGDYVIVLDNRQGRGARRVELRVTARRRVTMPDSLDRALEREIRRMGAKLHALFVFETVPVRARYCAAPSAYAGRGTVTICAEYVEKLHAAIDDRAATRNAVLFTVLHELAHVLLRQWDYAFAGDEAASDEFATVLAVLLGRRELAEAKADYFLKTRSLGEIFAKLLADDSHPLSAQRARNIRRWLADPGLVPRWQPVLYPHMRTAMLRKIARHAPAWADIELVRAELARREER